MTCLGVTVLFKKIRGNLKNFAIQLGDQGGRGEECSKVAQSPPSNVCVLLSMLGGGTATISILNRVCQYLEVGATISIFNCVCVCPCLEVAQRYSNNLHLELCMCAHVHLHLETCAHVNAWRWHSHNLHLDP